MSFALDLELANEEKSTLMRDSQAAATSMTFARGPYPVGVTDMRLPPPKSATPKASRFTVYDLDWTYGFRCICVSVCVCARLNEIYLSSSVQQGWKNTRF